MNTKNKRGLYWAAFLSLLATACSTSLRPPEPTLYDLASKMTATPTAEVRLLDMSGPSWLESSAMQYRLLYGDAGQRLTYTQSRWTASPTELLGHGLRRALLGEGSRAGSCRLKLELVEFIQSFDAPQASHVTLEVRAVIQPPKTEEGLIRKNFRLQHPAGADAASGVTALAAASQDLASGIQTWLAGPAGAVCR